MTPQQLDRLSILHEMSEEAGVPTGTKMRVFDTGATRNPDDGKLKYEGFLSPIVLKRFAEYMHLHRKQADGKLRDPDNWQKGIPRDAYTDSLVRHVMDIWLHQRGYSYEATEDLETALCATMFNTMGYLHAVLKERAQAKPHACHGSVGQSQPR